MSESSISHTEPIDTENIGSRTRTAIGWKAISQVMITGLHMVTGIVLARLLMPRDFGILGMATMVTGMAGIFRDLGLGQALIQRRNLEKVHLNSAYWGTLVMGALLTGLTLLLAPFIGTIFKEPRMVPVLQLISLTFVITPFATIPNAMLQRHLDFRRPFWASVVNGVVYAIVGIGMAVTGYSYWSLVYALLASTVASNVTLCIMTRHFPPLIPCFRGIKDLYLFGVGQSGVSLFNYIAGQADYFVVGRWLDTTMLGLYTRAFTLVHQPLTVIAQVITPVLFPMFAHMRDDKEKARAAMSRAFTMVSLFTFPFLTLFAVSAPEFIPLVFGKQWQAAVLPAQILTLAGMLRTLASPAGTLPKAYGYIYALLWRNIVYCVALAGLALVGTRWGIVGVSWGVLLSGIIFFILSVQLLSACSGLTLRDYLRSLRAAIVCSVLVMGLSFPARIVMISHGVSPIIVLAATLVLGGAAAALFILYGPFAECRSALQNLLKMAGKGNQKGLVEE